MTEKHTKKQTVTTTIEEEEIVTIEVNREEYRGVPSKTTGDSSHESELDGNGTDQGKSPVKKKTSHRENPSEMLWRYLTIMIIMIIALWICPTIVPEIIRIISAG